MVKQWFKTNKDFYLNKQNVELTIHFGDAQASAGSRSIDLDVSNFEQFWDYIAYFKQFFKPSYDSPYYWDLYKFTKIVVSIHQELIGNIKGNSTRPHRPAGGMRF